MCLKHDFELTSHFLSHPFPNPQTHMLGLQILYHPSHWSEQCVAWVVFMRVASVTISTKPKTILLSASPSCVLQIVLCHHFGLQALIVRPVQSMGIIALSVLIAYICESVVLSELHGRQISQHYTLFIFRKVFFYLFVNLLSPPTRLHKYPALSIPMIKKKKEKKGSGIYNKEKKKKDTHSKTVIWRKYGHILPVYFMHG